MRKGHEMILNTHFTFWNILNNTRVNSIEYIHVIKVIS